MTSGCTCAIGLNGIVWGAVVLHHNHFKAISSYKMEDEQVVTGHRDEIPLQHVSHLQSISQGIGANPILGFGNNPFTIANVN